MLRPAATPATAFPIFSHGPSSSSHTYLDASEVLSEGPSSLSDERRPGAECAASTSDGSSDPWAFDPFPAADVDAAIAAPRPDCDEWVLGCPPLAGGGGGAGERDPYRDDWLL